MKALRLIVILFASLFSQLANGHTMWVQVTTSAQKGVPQEVKVFFGEFSWGKPTLTEKWFSDIKDYKLMVTTPDGKTQELTDRRQDSACYVSTFTPEVDGLYTFWFVHEVKDVYKDKKLTYSSSAIMNVKADKKTTATLGQGKYQLLLPKVNRNKEIILLEDGKPAANQVVEMIQEGVKESLTVNTDEKGALQFLKDWKGNYLIEIPDSKKVESTDHNGKSYEYDYKVFSYYISL